MKANRLAKQQQRRKAVKAKARKSNKPLMKWRVLNAEPVYPIPSETHFIMIDCGAPLWDAKRPFVQHRIVNNGSF